MGWSPFMPSMSRYLKSMMYKSPLRFSSVFLHLWTNTSIFIPRITIKISYFHLCPQIKFFTMCIDYNSVPYYICGLTFGWMLSFVSVSLLPTPPNCLQIYLFFNLSFIPFRKGRQAYCIFYPTNLTLVETSTIFRKGVIT